MTRAFGPAGSSPRATAIPRVTWPTQAPPAITTKRAPITTSRATVLFNGVSWGAMSENSAVAASTRPA